MGGEGREVLVIVSLFQALLSFTNPEWRGYAQTLHALHVRNTLLSLNQGNFAKFCVAVSFALVDLKFLVQQSLSLTL